MESELDLNDIIQEMHVIATIPELYHLLVELHAVQSLLGLLSHENTDILSFKVLFLSAIKPKLYFSYFVQHDGTCKYELIVGLVWYGRQVKQGQMCY